MEHDDHPHFRCALRVRYRDDVPDETWSIAPDDPDPASDMPIEMRRGVEDHALIYTDGYVAVTIYECCYATWSVATGECLGGDLWQDRLHVLEPSSLALLRRHAEGVLRVCEATAAARVVDAEAALARVPATRPVEWEVARGRLETARGRHGLAKRLLHARIGD